ncbi:MAG: Dihydroorotate dehydrogenase B (NAD(+)), electron transfer subunit [Deltaproteobacteria bacterium ADurb.Bin510]|nr:MAG: Dihydroorotate dehydrogenase B (NAD(+)), electron transfer subunit [Deltaproteobacteria bacterium ADurb.Bin510]
MQLEGDLGSWRPGQFVMLKVSNSLEPFLRRPFGILSAGAGRVELYYKVKGGGTQAMSRLCPGSQVGLLGPLGNGFAPCAPDVQPLMVAGGTGLPPILALAAALERGTLLLGARDRQEMPLAERVQAIAGVHSVFATEDGSLGHRGLVTELMRRELAGQAGPVMVYACGPLAMLKAVAALAAEYGAACQVSLEERMGCGFGVCAGCAVGTTEGIRRVCKEGPVFDAAVMQWGQP